MAAKRTSAEKIKRPKTPRSSTASSVAEIELAAARKTIKKLKVTVAALEKRAAKLEKKADGLKVELKKLRSGTAKQVRKSGSATVKKVKKAKKIADVLVDHDDPAVTTGKASVEGDLPADEVTPAEEVAAATDVVPVADADPSDLTAAQLRAAAREQGVPGYSRMRKDQLIAALS